MQCTNARNVYAGLLLRTFQNQLRFFSTTANVCEQFRNHRKFYDDLRTVPKIFSNCIVYFLFCIVLYCTKLRCVVLCWAKLHRNVLYLIMLLCCAISRYNHGLFKSYDLRFDSFCYDQIVCLLIKFANKHRPCFKLALRINTSAPQRDGRGGGGRRERRPNAHPLQSNR